MGFLVQKVLLVMQDLDHQAATLNPKTLYPLKEPLKGNLCKFL